MEDFDEAIGLNPQFGAAYSNRGFALINLGQSQQAVADYTQAILLSSGEGDAYAGRALADILLGRDTEAEQDVERAVELGVDAASLKETIKGLRTPRAATT